MKNAKEELLEELNYKENIIECACIEFDDDQEENKKNIILKKDYSESDYEIFLQKLNFEYNNGYGNQKLSGYVWLKDGNWLERSGKVPYEWWEDRIRPKIPKELY